MTPTGQQWHLRPGQGKDRAACEALLLKHFQKEFDRYAIQWHSDRFALDWVEGHPTVACHEDQLLGFALWQEGRSPQTAWLHSVHVGTRYRLRGLGRALMRHVEAEALAAGRYVMELAVFEQSPAFYWYQKLGYARVGEPYFQTQLRKRLADDR